MPLRPLFISERRAQDLEKLINISDDKLVALREALAHVTTLLRLVDFHDVLKKYVEAKDAKDVTRLLLSLRRYSDGRSADISEVFSALVEGLKTFGWPSEKIDMACTRFG